MGIHGCHGMGAWSRQSHVELWWAPLGEQDHKTRRVPGDSLRTVPTWQGGGRIGKAGQAVSERNPGEKKYRTTGDTSLLTGPDRTSNTTRNNFVCEL
jgi:NADPH:quinone reductase-like Zn-dependent oxidoreductase